MSNKDVVRADSVDVGSSAPRWKRSLAGARQTTLNYRQNSFPVVVAVAALVGPIMFAGPARTYQITEVLVAVLFAVSVSFVIGMAGVPAFGNQLFYAAGAYMVAELSTGFGVTDLFIFLAASLAIGGLLGIVMSLFLRKVGGVAFGMVSMAVGQMAFLYVERSSLLGGDNGISGIDSGTLLGIPLATSAQHFAVVWFVMVCGIVAVALIARSDWGLVLRATRDSSVRASAVGIPCFRYQAVAFVIGALLSSVAGALMATTVRSVDSSMFYWTAGALPVLAGLMGGIRTVRGPVVGAVILSWIVIWVSEFTTAWLLVEGLLTLGVFMLWPEGLLGEAKGSGREAVMAFVRRGH